MQNPCGCSGSCCWLQHSEIPVLLPLPAKQVIQDAVSEQENPRPLLVPTDSQTRAQEPSGSSPLDGTLTLPGFAMAVGSVGHVPHCPPVMGTLGPVPKENPGPVALECVGSGQAQLLVGLARVQCWDRSSSPSGAGTCARTDPARSGAGTCDFRIDLSQLAALGTQQFQSP